MKLGIKGVVLSMFDRLTQNHSTDYDVKSEVLTVSVTDLGPKSLDVPSTEIEDFIQTLSDFDPDAEPGLVETVSRTLRCTDGVVSFRTSLAKGSRTVTVPAAEWSDFVRWWEVAGDSVSATVEKYQAIIAAEADAAE
jgi:hypothetical protein